MARIIEGKRRIIKISTDDILAIVKQYQQLTHKACCYMHIREILEKNPIYIPEEL